MVARFRRQGADGVGDRQGCSNCSTSCCASELQCGVSHCDALGSRAGKRGCVGTVPHGVGSTELAGCRVR